MIIIITLDHKPIKKNNNGGYYYFSGSSALPPRRNNAENVIKEIEDNPNIPKEKKSSARRVWTYSKEKHLQLIPIAMTLYQFFYRR
jgi:hypothetical protein